MLLGTATITDKELGRLKSRIGKELRVVQHKTVASQDNITWSAYAIGDDNPLWLDPAYASNTRYGCTIAPPSFLLIVLPTRHKV